jgi:hypothetical protein
MLGKWKPAIRSIRVVEEFGGKLVREVLMAIGYDKR